MMNPNVINMLKSQSEESLLFAMTTAYFDGDVNLFNYLGAILKQRKDEGTKLNSEPRPTNPGYPAPVVNFIPKQN